MNDSKAPTNSNRYLIFLSILILILASISCTNTLFDTVFEEVIQVWPITKNPDPFENDDEFVGGDDENYEGDASASDNSGANPAQDQSSSTTSSSGPLKPVGFVNYGEIDATVRAYSFMPLGKTEAATPPSASTVSSANSGSGEWPNSSRFISVPMGAYSWCIEWEEGDVDEDGKIDYFHYIQEGPTILDENDSDELDLAEEVGISAPPATGATFVGRCQLAGVENSCEGQPQSLKLYTSPGWIIPTAIKPEVIADAHYSEFPPPEGITLNAGGGHGYQRAWFLDETGHYLEATTSRDFSAMGVQPHGPYNIGWARVLFDGVEVWRGDTSSYYHDAEGYMHAVYVEVRCFPPGTHTLRIESLGIEGSGGAQGNNGGISVPIAYFGFRP